MQGLGIKYQHGVARLTFSELDLLEFVSVDLGNACVEFGRKTNGAAFGSSLLSGERVIVVGDSSNSVSSSTVGAL